MVRLDRTDFISKRDEQRGIILTDLLSPSAHGTPHKQSQPEADVCASDSRWGQT